MLSMLRSAGTVMIAASTVIGSDIQAQSKRPMTFEDFAAVRIVGGPQISPDGKSVIYTVRTTDVEGNKRKTESFIVSSSGGEPKRFPSADISMGEATWSPDGLKIAYTAGGQLWVIDANGSNPRQLTSLHGGASGPIWSPKGDKIAFVSAGYPECETDECNVAKAKQIAESQVKAIVTDRLLYRHWNAYGDGTKSHLYVVGLDGGAPKNLTPKANFHVPPPPFGGSEAYRFSPDGAEISYTAKDVGREEAWSTDIDVYIVPVSGGAATNITKGYKGSDYNAVYSPDGKSILFGSQERAGFESDQHRLMIYDRGSKTITQLVKGWDRDAYSYSYSPDGNIIYIGTVEASRNRLYALTKANGKWADRPVLVTGDKMNSSSFSFSADGKKVIWLADGVHTPGEIYSADLNGAALSNVAAITKENAGLLSQLQLNKAEEFWFKGAAADSVQGFVIKPPQFKEGEKFPVLLVIHGGPQVPFLDSWHQRWNFAMFAAGGFGVVFINPTGSPGYGQKFVDQVTKDWGGAAYQDLMLGLDAALANNPWMDSTRMGAAGGSYGGYMVNWINGNTNRFKALVNHAGVFNLENMYGATEEVWFTEYEFGGPYWNKSAMDGQYRRWSPHLYAGSMRTPTLVIHGELDYRVPLTEGLSAFTVLQRQNVDSKLIIFPDEGHWVTKPQNQRLWYGEFTGWFAKHLK